LGNNSKVKIWSDPVER